METRNERMTFDGMADGQAVEAVKTDTGADALTGYPVVWGAISTPRANGKRYQFFPGSIVWTPEVYALVHHDYAKPVASTAIQTLELSEDDVGVQARIIPADTTIGRDAKENVTSGLVRGMSFGGVLIEEQATNQPGVYRVVKFIADEVTITPRPAMVETHIKAEPKLVEAKQEDEPVEEKSFDSKKESVRIARNKLNTFKLATLKPGTASGKAK